MRITGVIAILAGALLGAGGAWAAVAAQAAATSSNSGSPSHSILPPIGAYHIADQIKDPPPLLKAILDDHVNDAARLLKQGASATAVYRDFPYFATAASLQPCDPSMLDLLLAHGAKVDGVWVTFPGHHGDPPLDTYVDPLAAAASAGSEACVATLIRHGATPNIVDMQGITPLGGTAASMYCKPEMIDFLIKHGADPNFAPSLDDLPPKIVSDIVAGEINLIARLPPLDLAVMYDHPACARALLKDGADPDAHTADGSLLMDAVGVGRSPAITRMLLHAGADVHVRNERGETAMFAVLFLQGAGPKFGGPYGHYCLECARMLIEAGADVDAVDNAGNTPLVYAARGEDALPMVKLLVNAGADVNYRNPKTGLTPLHTAQLAHNAAVADYLIRHGASAPADATDGSPAGKL